MSETKYLNFRINDRPVDVESVEAVPISIDYELENEDNFSEKKSSVSLDISVPATLENDTTFGTYHDANIENDAVKNAMDCLIEANGIQLFKGKALVKSTVSQNGNPKAYKLNFYGNNGDWMLPLQDSTLHDFLSSHTHIFNQSVVFNTWYNFNGLSETLDYFYCPVRYSKGLTDGGMTTLDLRPSISVYWIIWRAFKSLGYKIQSSFLDSAYFRGLVLPWTWGDFLLMDSSKLDPLKFKATGTPTNMSNYNGDSYWSFFGDNTDADYLIGDGAASGNVTNDTFELSYTSSPLGYDNGGNYSYNTSSGVMQYVFNGTQASLLGVTDIEFTISVPASFDGGECSLWIDWTVIGGGISDQAMIYDNSSIDDGIIQDTPFVFTVKNVSPGATIQMILFARINVGAVSSAAVRVYGRYFFAGGGGPTIQILATTLEVTGFKKVVGSIVDLKIYDELKNYNFLDLLRGLIDLFDLQFQSDPINKIVVIEPTYPYYTGSNPLSKITGYFGLGKIDWSQKMDLAKESELELYSDIEQEFNMLFKDDSSDGAAKRFVDRNSTLPGSSKYIFPNRFKTGKKDNENRFFTPVMHIRMDEWKTLSDDQVSPQLIAMIPENISNTSASTSQYKFGPKIAFARRVNLSDPVFKNGRIKFENASYGCPEMFAVNYNKGGENDPVLTYSDQNVDSATNPKGAVVHGLMRRFFLQRLSIMRYGKRHKAWYNLSTSDITNFYHREAIIQDNAIYHLFNIYGYKPLASESTQCYLWKWFPMSQADSDSCFPSLSSVTNGVLISGGKDTVYQRLLALPSDLIG
ncbi:hypothetical protein F0919_17905 [Taibaiella lutea]|uniref:Uncharacterized protein n=1 Tax=Taibaiella lutea TaxID=2608001 RepID=A0A5M6CC00_9BACT|nr:hypothetical protein [Taibaiella lutea]KAA5532656.1 hypothetical protein F0919_17905 [Taibaiella lutea]